MSVAARDPATGRDRTARQGLRCYGGVLVLVSGLVPADLITPSAPVNEHALRWHVFVWDLWFLVWGMAFGLAAWRYRTSDRSP